MTQTLRDEVRACLTAFSPEGETSAHVAWIFPQSFAGFRGHFPENPICPGVCLVMAQLEAASRLVGAKLELLELENVKFMWPVFPDRQVDGRLSVASVGDSRWRVQAEMKRGARRIAKFLILAREAGEGSAATT